MTAHTGGHFRILELVVAFFFVLIVLILIHLACPSVSFGGVWGINNLIRATTNPLWVMFTNPLISVVPRILVGLIAGLLFALLNKKIRSRTVCAVITAVLSTLIHTALVLTALYTFGGMIDSYSDFFEMFKTIFTTVLTLNGSIELVAAIVIVPAIDLALQKSRLLNAAE